MRDLQARGAATLTAGREADEHPFVAHDAAFAAVTGRAPRLVRVVDCNAHEGPVYAPDEDALYFTTLPVSTSVPLPGYPLVAIKRLVLDGLRLPLDPERISLVCADARQANGMARASDGELIVCEQGSHANPAAIARVAPATGTRRPLVDAFRGLALNSPNDVVLKSDGSIWFTDPSYGFLQGFRATPRLGDYVFRLDPDSGALSVVADGLDKPNGLAFSPDERTLYVGDSGANQEAGSFHVARPHHIVAFDVRDGRHLGPARLFAHTSPGFPDGMAVDEAGRVYASAFGGVQVFSPEGDLIGEIALPGAVNHCFGGPEGNLLFITADHALWAAVLEAVGPPPPPTDHRVPKGA